MIPCHPMFALLDDWKAKLPDTISWKEEVAK